MKTRMDVCTPDALIMPPGCTIVKGRQAIENLEKRNQAMFSDVSFTISEVGDVGSCLYTIIATKMIQRDTSETVSVMMSLNGNTMPRKSRYMAKGPPDGGWGWMVVISAFLVLFVVRGIQNSVGVFFAVLLDYFQEGAGATSWMSASISAVSLCMGPFAAALANRFGHRIVVFVGGLLTSISIVMSAFAPNIIFISVTFGFCTGVGFGLARVPAVAMLGKYFKRRHAIASGLSVVGTGCGAFIISPLLRSLINVYGWRGSFIILGGISLHMCVSGALLRPIHFLDDNEHCEDEHISDSRRKETYPSYEDKSKLSCLRTKINGIMNFFELSLLKNHMFAMLLVSDVFFGFGINIPVVHIVKRGLNVGLDHGDAAFLPSVLGFCMMFGALGQGFVVDVLHLCKIRSLAASTIIYGLSTLMLTLAHDFTSMCAVLSTMGLARGVFASLNSVVVKVVVGQKKFTSAYGLTLPFIGIAQLIGPVVAGYMYDYNGNYNVSFYLSGASVLLSAVILLISQFVWLRSKKSEAILDTETNNDETISHVLEIKEGYVVRYLPRKQAELLAQSEDLSDIDDDDCLECVGAIHIEKDSM
ncbi:monocarboxylate transporter 12-like [Saccoglossus kowalevskii]|uniref:Monocarboxylate transporter 12-like n=1 Tax=Saccoglossus kowalevskii TaxID=10224 RepID=A0ABM0MWI2_SACKO|nr:PREDICTED: monocarboxylate transporter 12-like [Saccoglossus kowalevskii]